MSKINLYDIVDTRKKEREKRIKEREEKSIEELYLLLKKGNLIESLIDEILSVEQLKGSVEISVDRKYEREFSRLWCTSNYTVEEAINRLIKSRYGYDTLLKYLNSIFEPKVIEFKVIVSFRGFYSSLGANYKFKRKGIMRILSDKFLTKG